MNILFADLGGTNCRCAVSGQDGAIAHRQNYINQEFSGIAELLLHYLSAIPEAARPSRAAIAVAAPVRGDQINMVNSSWSYSSAALCAELGLKSLTSVNDFDALAYALPHLEPVSLSPAGPTLTPMRAPKVVLGPGTGLGVAITAPVGDSWTVLEGEGGHVTLAASNEPESRALAKLRERFGHCSAERVLSGPGISNLHHALHDQQLDPAEVGTRALGGDEQATATINMFFAFLGTVASDLAVTAGAFGGVYIAGGIVPRYLEQLAASDFRRRFESKGRYSDYMTEIATTVITDDEAVFAGLRQVC